MPNNSKIEFAGTVLLDLTEDTVSPETMEKGTTAHDKSGAPIVGSMEVVTVYSGSEAPTPALGVDGDLYLQK